MANELLKRLTVGAGYKHLLIADNIINHTGEDWVIHNLSLEGQKESRDLMSRVLDAGYSVTVKLKDGKLYQNVHPSEVRVKWVYNTGVSAPDLGVVMWTPGTRYTGSIVHHKTEKPEPVNKYRRKIKSLEVYDDKGQPTVIDVFVDVYDVIHAFGVTSGPLQHAIKKLVMAGQRGHKDELEDLHDILASVKREIEMVKER